MDLPSNANVAIAGDRESFLYRQLSKAGLSLSKILLPEQEKEFSERRRSCWSYMKFKLTVNTQTLSTNDIFVTIRPDAFTLITIVRKSVQWEDVSPHSK